MDYNMATMHWLWPTTRRSPMLTRSRWRGVIRLRVCGLLILSYHVVTDYIIYITVIKIHTYPTSPNSYPLYAYLLTYLQTYIILHFYTFLRVTCVHMLTTMKAHSPSVQPSADVWLGPEIWPLKRWWFHDPTLGWRRASPELGSSRSYGAIVGSFGFYSDVSGRSVSIFSTGRHPAWRNRELLAVQLSQKNAMGWAWGSNQPVENRPTGQILGFPGVILGAQPLLLVASMSLVQTARDLSEMVNYGKPILAFLCHQPTHWSLALFNFAPRQVNVGLGSNTPYDVRVYLGAHACQPICVRCDGKSTDLEVIASSTIFDWLVL